MKNEVDPGIRRLTNLAEDPSHRNIACKAIDEFMGGSKLEDRLATLKAIADLNASDRETNPNLPILKSRVHFDVNDMAAAHLWEQTYRGWLHGVRDIYSEITTPDASHQLLGPRRVRCPEN